MKLIRNAVGMSKLILILLLLVAAIVGAVLSYMWTVGYYVSLELQLPEAPTVAITDVDFDPQDAKSFNLTLLNPSLSPFSASITQVMASTGDGDLHDDIGTDPTLSELSIGESKTFTCFWNWANYTDENVNIHVLVKDGSGATFQKKTPLVKLAIIEAVFNSTISVTHFNMTIRNSASSVTPVNITAVTVDSETVQNATPSLPYTLNPNTSIPFTCYLNWTEYQGKKIVLEVETSQGYTAQRTQTTPQPVVLEITDILFNVTNTTRFSVTVQNNASSPTYVNVTRVTVNVNETIQETELNVTLPFTLHPSSEITLLCSWDWENYQSITVTITVHTTQEFEISYVYELPGG